MNPRKPSIFLSLFTILALMAMLFVTISVFKDDALSGAIQVVLLTAAALAALIAVLYCRVPYKEVERQVAQNFVGVLPALVMLLFIGSLSGSWMVSGVIPALIYYGLQIMQSGFFLVSCCVLCCLVSLMTGSSWATIATIGVALIGIGVAQGFSTGWVAGAIISGAYFGDKISPLSDTTVLASTVCEVPLFTHIRYMLFTTVPSITISLIVFGIAGYTREKPDLTQIAAFSGALKETFDITPWLLIVPLATAVMIAKKLPAIVVLFFSSLLAGIFAVIFQPELLQGIAGGVDVRMATFKGFMQSFYGETHITTANTEVNDLIATKGMAGMLNTVWLITCAVCFGGVMTANGMLRRVTDLMIRFMKGRTSTVAATVISGVTLNICTADQYISIILNGEMLKDLYRKNGFENRLLSRATEDSATVTSVLIPWSSCGMTQATVLGVSTLVYFPYCIFNIISPLMSIAVASTGYKIYKRGNSGVTHQDSRTVTQL